MEINGKLMYEEEKFIFKLENPNLEVFIAIFDNIEGRNKQTNNDY